MILKLNSVKLDKLILNIYIFTCGKLYNYLI